MNFYDEDFKMIVRIKTLIIASAIAVVATAAVAQHGWDFKAGMAYMYGGPNKMSAMAMAPASRDGMMKAATKVPANTTFFMENGELYSVSGMLDPTGNFYRP